MLRIAWLLLTLMAGQVAANQVAPNITPVATTPPAVTSPTTPAATATAPVTPTPVPAIPVQTPVNPLTGNLYQLPNFALLQPNFFEPALNQAMQNYNDTLVTALSKPASWQNTVQPLEEAINKVFAIWNLVNIVNSVNHSEQTHEIYEKLYPKVYVFHNSVMQNAMLFKAYLNIEASADFAKLNAMQQTVVKQAILEFKLYGADLPATKQLRYKQITQRLSALARQFSDNLNATTAAWQYFIAASEANKLDGVPYSTKSAAASLAKAQGKDGWILTLDDQCLVAVMSYAKNRDLRQTMYQAYITLASDQDPDATHKKWDNTQVITETLKLRQELATLLGYSNYAEFVAADQQPPQPEAAMQFLQQLVTKTRPVALQQFAKLKDYATQRDSITDFQAWDVAYYAEALKYNLYRIDEEQTRQYFSYNQVTTGLFNLCNILFGFQISEAKDAAVWDQTVKAYLISDPDNNQLGYFYLDLTARPNKREGFWILPYLNRLQADKKDNSLLPSVVITANFKISKDNSLSHNEVIALFNAFGRMLQMNLALLAYPDLSGSSDMADNAATLSSQFMQNWTWEMQVMQDISKNPKNGQTIPKDLFDNLLAARNFDAGIDLLSQVEFAMFDLRLHMALAADKNKSAMEILNSIRQQYAVLPSSAYDMLPNRFKNIFALPYAANCYQFIWAQMLAADALAAFNENGLFSSKIGHKYLQTIFQKSGQDSALNLFVEFRGRQPDPKFLLQQQGILN